MKQKDANGEIRRRQLSIATFDLKDFFTNIPRERFLRDLEKCVDRMKDHHSKPSWF